jgi:hypothetical protein
VSLCLTTTNFSLFGKQFKNAGRQPSFHGKLFANGVLDSVLRSTKRELLDPKGLFGMAVRLETYLRIDKLRALNVAFEPSWHSFVGAMSLEKSWSVYFLRQAFVPPLLTASKGSWKDYDQQCHDNGVSRT